MADPVAVIIDAFKHLTPDEQTTAYLEIEALWKNMQDDEPAGPPASFTALRFPPASKLY